MVISTYQRGVQVQTAITRMTTVIVITKAESLTLILDRIEAYISLPDNAPLLSILRFETPQRYCVVQRTQVRLVMFNLTSPWICANVVFCLRNGGGLPSLEVFHAGPHSTASSNSGSSIRPFPDLDVSYPTYPDCLEGQGGGFSPVVSLSPSVVWVGGRLSVGVQEHVQERI